MLQSDRLLEVYLHLARASDLRRQPMVSDKLLVLAGVTAAEMGLDEISAVCRHKILMHNSWHIVGRWPTLDAALADERFQVYLKQLRRRYSPEKAEHMLASLGIELARERDSYFSLPEYAAVLLGTKLEALGGLLAQDPAAVRDTTAAPGDSASPSPDARPRVLRTLAAWQPFVLGLLALLGLAIAHRLISAH